ncbi:probable tubulin polyglutamylase ttll-15 isoform X1 [Schistocerca piceifrons]|uniref:probable tubulin polyglutamylase ttll-15 isoform X1 n=1 Tax=Schistocerca piceifrons TaxID=274613 RepID=UPI001F5E6616|nr:probable tubulin polyglutamylase ttll-15 isoform X1 [Schistocerca piceifrons]
MPSKGEKESSATGAEQVAVRKQLQKQLPPDEPTGWHQYKLYASYVLVATAAYIVPLLLTPHHDKQLKCVSTDDKANTSISFGPSYALYGQRLETGYLRHVEAVLRRLGYSRTVAINSSEWDLLWAHDYPFRTMPELRNLKPHQKVNHFPGSGYITNKVDLSTSNLPYIPAAFRLPRDKEKFLQYAASKPAAVFVQKHNQHRGIKILSLDEMNLNDDGTFVQEYVSNPLLIDGYKFDIGVYTVLTSVDPLRLYVYGGDILFRFCPVKYHPFDPTVLDKYVVGDDYLPIWEVPSLKSYYNDLGFSMKESFDAYMKSIGKDTDKIWNQVDEAIRNIYLAKEALIIQISSKFKSTSNFFEMVRIDLVLDEDLNVYLMEANMSPNLSSAHFPPNQLLYEQVLYSVFSLVGVGRILYSSNRKNSDEEAATEEMQASLKNIVVFPEICKKCSSCDSHECLLCRPCLTGWTLNVLRSAYKEHVFRRDCRRLFPPSMDQAAVSTGKYLEDLTPENQLMVRWFQGKCLQNKSWCL